MTLRLSAWLGLPFCLLLGCNNTGGSAAPAASSSTTVAQTAQAPSASATASAAVAAASASAGRGDMEHHGPGRGGDFTGMMFRNARDLPGISDDQKTKLDTLQGPLRGDDPGDAFKTFHDDLVSMVKAGKIDNTKISADQAAVDAATKAHVAREVVALNGLHDALTPDQRKALVAAMQAKQAEREAREAQHAPPGDAGPADFAARRLAQMTTELGLDAGQQAQLKALLAKSAPTAAQMKADQDAMKAKAAAFTTAFAADTFDASKVFPLGGMQQGDMMKQHVQMLTQLLPILHPDQQQKLAAAMERMTMMGHGRGDDDDHDIGGGRDHDEH
jgi:Spy/CpxP family protein refolding chaperone